MKNEIIFQIAVSGGENFEWQGEIRMPDGTASPFRSVIELLKAMDEHIREAENKCADAQRYSD